MFRLIGMLSFNIRSKERHFSVHKTRGWLFVFCYLAFGFVVTLLAPSLVYAKNFKIESKDGSHWLKVENSDGSYGDPEVSELLTFLGTSAAKSNLDLLNEVFETDAKSMEELSGIVKGLVAGSKIPNAKMGIFFRDRNRLEVLAELMVGKAKLESANPLLSEEIFWHEGAGFRRVVTIPKNDGYRERTFTILHDRAGKIISATELGQTVSVFSNGRMDNRALGWTKPGQGKLIEDAITRNISLKDLQDKAGYAAQSGGGATSSHRE
jgi:hypothetical protein